MSEITITRHLARRMARASSTIERASCRIEGDKTPLKPWRYKVLLVDGLERESRIREVAEGGFCQAFNGMRAERSALRFIGLLDEMRRTLDDRTPVSGPFSGKELRILAELMGGAKSTRILAAILDQPLGKTHVMLGGLRALGMVQRPPDSGDDIDVPYSLSQDNRLMVSLLADKAFRRYL